MKEKCRKRKENRALLLRTLLIMSHTTDETMEAKANGGAKQQAIKEKNKK